MASTLCFFLHVQVFVVFTDLVIPISSTDKPLSDPKIHRLVGFDIRKELNALADLSFCSAWTTSIINLMILDWFGDFFLWYLDLKSGFCTYKAGALALEPLLQCIFLWLFWRWFLIKYLPKLTRTIILPISASQVARITGVSTSTWHLIDFLHQNSSYQY
jgi:hypothetical protein